MRTNDLVFGTVDDPAEAAEIHARIERGQRNLKWLGEHWVDLLPHARGKFVAVAAQHGHVAESAEEVWAWAKSAHPEDDGVFVQYVRLETGPRIYANRGEVAPLEKQS